MPQTKPSTGRNSAIELLRVIAMLGIICSHICYHSGFDYIYSYATRNRMFVPICTCPYICVNIFFMITGYFQWNRPLRRETISRLLSQVWFYSLVIFVICRFLLGVQYTPSALLQVFFPTIFNEYWFFTVFFISTLLTPFVNLAIAAMNRKQFQVLLALMTVIWSVIPTFTRQGMYGNEFIQLMIFYFYGAYFSRFPDNIFRKAWLRWASTLVGFFGIIVVSHIYAALEETSALYYGAALSMYNCTHVLMVLWTLGTFSLAVYRKPFTCKFINTLSACTFGVYLIHDNPAMRHLLWKQWLNLTLWFTSPSLIVRILATTVLVFSVCTVIEFLRLKFLAKPTAKLVDRLLAKVWKE